MAITLWAHQSAALEFLRDRESGMLAMDMGTGKTLVTLLHLRRAAALNILVICPRSVLAVWRREIALHAPGDWAVQILGGWQTTAEKSRRLRSGGVVVVNYDSVWRKELGERLAGEKWDAVVCDESHRIKSPSSRASRWIGRNLSHAPLRLCLTGTPMPHSPLDVYGQFRFLNRDAFGESYTRFRSRYALTSRRFPSQVLKFINQDEMQTIFGQNSFVCKAGDVLDLPGTIDEEIPVELERPARRAYDAVKRDFVAALDDGTITATNTLTQLLRLQQLAGGVAQFDGDPSYTIIGREKATALRDLLEGIDTPVVVFCRFRADLDAVRDCCEQMNRVYGELSGRENDLTVHAEYPEGVDVLGVQIQSGGVGVDLTRAHFAVYFSLGYSLGDYLQSRARLDRPGQKHCVRFYHLVAEKTVDSSVYKALEKRAAIVAAVLEGLKYERE